MKRPATVTILLSSFSLLTLTSCQTWENLGKRDCDDLCRQALAGFLVNDGGFASTIHPYVLPTPQVSPPPPAAPFIVEPYIPPQI